MGALSILGDVACCLAALKAGLALSTVTERCQWLALRWPRRTSDVSKNIYRQVKEEHHPGGLRVLSAVGRSVTRLTEVGVISNRLALTLYLFRYSQAREVCSFESHHLRGLYLLLNSGVWRHVGLSAICSLRCYPTEGITPRGSQLVLRKLTTSSHPDIYITSIQWPATTNMYSTTACSASVASLRAQC